MCRRHIAKFAVLRTIGGLVKGNYKLIATILNVIKSGFNPKTRMYKFIQGIKEIACSIEVKVPDGFEPYKLTGEKSNVFKQTGNNIWISGDIVGHLSGFVWKRATGKLKIY